MSERNLHYNFVFFFARDDFWLSILGKELYESEYVHVYREAFEGPVWMRKLFHYHWAYRINRHINLPFKQIWFRRMYRQKFTHDLPLCFVYLGGNNIYRDGGFTRYVRRRDPRNRQILVDIISKKSDYDYSIVRNKVDLATTFDQGEAEKYGIHYFREDTYSKLIELPEQFEFESDVYFLGAAKDRLDDIMAIYRKLHEAGLKCLFILAGVPKEKQIEADGIEYTTGISYEENLRHVVKTKCMLELVQGGSVDITTRAIEAIAYQRRLLTNCQCVPRAYYHETQLQVFETPESIDVNFIKQDFDPGEYEPLYDLDPMRRLYFFQEKLAENDNKNTESKTK